MGHPFINNDPSHTQTVIELQREIRQMKSTIDELEKQIDSIQLSCKHIFVEFEGFRKCMKCQKAEGLYY